MTYTHDGKPYTFTFDGSGKVSGVWENGSFTTNYDGTYTYSRSADGNGASLTMYTTSGTSALGMTYSQTFDMELSFSSTTQATAQVSYTNKESYNGNDIPADEEDEYTTSVTFSGVQNNGSSDGESNDDTSSDGSAQLAPDSLPVGTVVNLQSSSGTKTSYTLTTADTCTSESGSTLKWEYSNTGDTTADLVTYNALNIPLMYKLVFTSSDGGTYTYVNVGGEASVTGTFNLSDKSDAPSQGDSSEDAEDDTPSEPVRQPALAEDDYTPNSNDLNGCTLICKNNIYNFLPDGKVKAIFYSGADSNLFDTCTYSYMSTTRDYARIIVTMDSETRKVVYTFYIDFKSKSDVKQYEYQRCSGEAHVNYYNWNKHEQATDTDYYNEKAELKVPYSY